MVIAGRRRGASSAGGVSCHWSSFSFTWASTRPSPWIAVLQRGNPFDTVQRGRAGVDPSLVVVVLLLIVESLIPMIDCHLRRWSLAASPVIFCVHGATANCSATKTNTAL